MIEYLYRFRPLQWLLDEGELRNQEIYFAEPEQLNDPMEGFRDVFWKGDTIVWRNFFRHYVLCLDNAFFQLMEGGEEQSLGWKQIPVFNHGELNDGVPHKAMEQELLRAFFSEPSVVALIEALAARSLPVRRDELSAHLRCLHMFALHLIRQAYVRRGLQPELPDSDAVVAKLKEVIDLATQSIHQFQEIEKQHPINEYQIDTFYIARQKLVAELDLVNFYNGTIDFRHTNRNFVCLTFPDEFVRKVETLVYPEWYAACFIRDCRNAAIWGTYGDKHTAVCLRFHVTEARDKPGLRLKRAHGINSAGPILDFVNHNFHEIKYESEHLPIDFFRSLGRFPIPVLRKYWYSDENGNQSPCGGEIFRADQQWRDCYWDAFYHGITRKLKDWSNEQEYRLILNNYFMDFRAPEARKLPYHFADLSAIIFGIKTPMKAKLEVCKIIEEKCRKEGRSDFKFYQAFYARSTGSIEHAEMGSLKFVP